MANSCGFSPQVLGLLRQVFPDPYLQCPPAQDTVFRPCSVLGVGAVTLCLSTYLKIINQAETKVFFNLKVDLFITYIAEDEL